MNGHKLAWITHQDNFITILLLSEMITVNIRIIWTYQNAFPALSFLVCPWQILQKSKLHQTPANFHPKGLLGRSLFFFFKIYSDLIVKSPPLISFHVALFRGMVLPPSVSELSTVGQTGSSSPPVSKGCSGSSNFVR